MTKTDHLSDATGLLAEKVANAVALVMLTFTPEIERCSTTATGTNLSSNVAYHLSTVQNFTKNYKPIPSKAAIIYWSCRSGRKIQEKFVSIESGIQNPESGRFAIKFLVPKFAFLVFMKTIISSPI